MVHVDHFSRQTDHLKAAVVAGPLRVSFEDTNPNETIKVAEENEPWLLKPPTPSTDITWMDRAQLAATPWWEIPIKVQEEDNLFIHQSTVNPHETAPKYVLVILYDDEGIYMSQRINSNKLMYLKYQMPCGKTEPEEMGIKAAYRETAEKTNLIIEKDRLLYLANDPTFDCDIYYAKLREGEILE